MSTILLIRHAETDLAGTFCGHANPPVNARGTAQIESLLNTLGHYSIAAIHTSDLLRAHTTAQAIANKLAVPLYPSTNLREIHFGDWEALTWPQIEQHDSAYAKLWADQYPLLSAPNGEAFNDFESRVLPHIDTIISHNDDAAIVTHAGVIRTVMTHRCNLSTQQARELTKNYCCVFDLTRKELVIQ
jgi:alpha-ribazole phosphatase/probable phosphoglycerate mutase